jgi:phage shock protein C
MDNRRFARSKNAMLFGVCAGLAEYTGISTGLMRALWILFAILTWMGLAFIAYIVLAFVMAPPQDAPEGDRFWHHVNGRNVMIAIAVVLICSGVYIIADAFLHVYIQRYLFPVGLVLGGGLLMAFAFKGRGAGR